MLKASLEIRLQAFHLNLHLNVHTSQTTVLLGESGAGKSTVLRLLAGLMRPTNGLIELDGEVYFDSERQISRPPQKRSVGYVFQDYTLFPHLNVFENIAFGLKAQGLSGKLVNRRVGEALELVHLLGYDLQRAEQLSGGQQQRVALARALVLQPKLLLLDEPLSALDVQTKREVRQELRQILKQAEVTTVLVTHQYIEALLFGQQILVLERGRVVQQGTQRDLLQHPRSAYVAELAGMNFFQGRVSQCEGSSICTIQLANNGKLSVEIQAKLEENGIEMTGAELPIVNREAYVVIDPRSITLYAEPPESSARNSFRGEVIQLLHAGSYSSEDGQRTGWMRVSLLIAASTIPLIAEITESSAERMELCEGRVVYAAFKAMEARAYI